MTASEFPRLRPFIPSISDDPATVRKLLSQFRDVYLDEMEAMNETYSPAGGFRSHEPTVRYLDAARSRAAGAPASSDTPPPASPPAATGKAPAAKPADKPALIYDPATGGFK